MINVKKRFVLRQALIFFLCLSALSAYRHSEIFFFRNHSFFYLLIGVTFGQAIGVLILLWPHSFLKIKKWIFFALIFLGIVFAFFHPELRMRFQYRSSLRLQGVFSSPNHFGVLMGVGFLMAIGSLIKRIILYRSSSQKVGVYLLSLSTLITGAVLLGSYSRGALTGTMVGFFYLFIVLRKYKDQVSFSTELVSRFIRGVNELRYPVAWMFGSLAIIAFWNFRYTEVPVIRRIFSIFNWNDFSIRNRGLEYLGELQILANHIWNGVGFGQTMNMYDGYYRDPVLSEIPGGPSNGWLDLATSVGLLGLLVFIAIVGLSFCPRRIGDKRLSADHFNLILVRAVIILLLVSSFFSGNFFFWPTSLILWMFLELAWQSEIAEFDRKRSIQVRSGNKTIDDNLI